MVIDEETLRGYYQFAAQEFAEMRAELKGQAARVHELEEALGRLQEYVYEHEHDAQGRVYRPC
jgi:hypothetical protein